MTMTDDSDIEMRLGSGRFAASRYRGYKKFSDSILEVYFDQPRDVCRIEGEENVGYALAEIQDVLTPKDPRGMWTEL